MMFSLAILFALMPVEDSDLYIRWPRPDSGEPRCVSLATFGPSGSSTHEFCCAVCPDCPVCPVACGYREGSTPASAFTRCMGGPGRKASPICAAFFDCDDDGDVDLRDLATLLDEGKR